MTQQTSVMDSVMNSPTATDCARSRYFLDSVAAYVAAGHRAVAALATAAPATAARATMSRAPESTPLILSSVRMVTPTRSTGANETLVRFQRDIVPELDAAYNFARFLSRDADAAQDIVQEAFLRAYRSFDGYQGGDARAWIFAIVRNCYHNWLTDRRRKALLEVDVHGKGDCEESAIDNVPSDEDSPETALLRRAESGAVRLVLNKLPRSLREILVLRELEGLSYRQIAEIAALPIGTVMSRLARARLRFESAWRQESPEETDHQENPT